MNIEFQIADQFLFPLFDEIYVVKERDFSIEYNPLGAGKHKLLLLVSCKTAEYLEDADLQFLKTIVDKGLRKTMEDVWVVNLERFPSKKLDELFDYFSPQQMIIWGEDKWLGGFGYPIGTHQHALVKGVEVLQALPLGAYPADQAAKGKLWLAMQRMFFN